MRFWGTAALVLTQVTTRGTGDVTIEKRCISIGVHRSLRWQPAVAAGSSQSHLGTGSRCCARRMTGTVAYEECAKLSWVSNEDGKIDHEITINTADDETQAEQSIETGNAKALVTGRRITSTRMRLSGTEFIRVEWPPRERAWDPSWAQRECHKCSSSLQPVRRILGTCSKAGTDLDAEFPGLSMALVSCVA